MSTVVLLFNNILLNAIRPAVILLHYMKVRHREIKSIPFLYIYLDHIELRGQ